MKKVSFFLVFMLLGITLTSIAQTTPPADFFAGKWEINITGTPSGDTKFVTNLVRKDGKLTGELKDPTGAKPSMPLTKIEEEANKVTLYFESSQAGEVPLELTKVDDDHLKGQVMNMFDTTAQRVKP